jgi:tetratricopeptide (TPR) repeat protein
VVLQQKKSSRVPHFAVETAPSGIHAMPALPADQSSPTRDIDISKPNSGRRPAPKGQAVWWLIVIAVVAILGLRLSLPDDQMAWGPPGLAVILATALFVGFVSWYAVWNGLFTWMRLARAPAKALGRGDKAAAEQAFAVALTRARRFPPHDHRHGLMLVELAGYLKLVGRTSEAKTLFEEAVEILEQEWKRRPYEYFIALNNLAVYLIDILDYAGAQRILERLLDMTLFWSKGGIKRGLSASNASFIELLLHLNLVVLFVRMEKLDLAADHLEEADAHFGKLVKPQSVVLDWYHGVRALLLSAQGQSTTAADELDKVRDVDSLMCLSVRAKLSLARGDYSQAERHLRRHLDLVGKQGSVHRPDVREQVLDLAESLFGGGKYDEAFHALNEARALTRDFALPAAPAWRKALAAWLRRARQLGRTAAVAWLEAEWQRTSTAPEQAITISPRLRIRRTE